MDGAPPYPCKRDIFHDTWEEQEEGLYSRKALSRLIQVKPGDEIKLITLEGETSVRHPDYIVLGARNEVYSNSEEWVKNNLTFL